MNHYSAPKEGVGEISLPAAEGMFFQRATLDHGLQEKDCGSSIFSSMNQKLFGSSLTFFIITRQRGLGFVWAVI